MKVYDILCTEQIREDLTRYDSVASLSFIDDNLKKS